MTLVSQCVSVDRQVSGNGGCGKGAVDCVGGGVRRKGGGSGCCCLARGVRMGLM